MLISKLPNTHFDLNTHNGSIGDVSEDECNTSYVAIEKDQTIGVQVIERDGQVIHSIGTVVRQYRRRRHVADKLWKAMIEHE